jgi:hypothetical protein
VSPNGRFTIVLPEPFRTAAHWARLQASNRIICLGSFELVSAAVDTAVSAGVEIGHIVFDRSISAEEFLEFLAHTSPGHCADIFMIEPNGSGYLSAVTRVDGRVLYRLRPEDVMFYLRMQYGFEPDQLACAS